VSKRLKVGPVSDRPSAAKPDPGRSRTGPASPRPIALRNAHPRLRIPRAAVTKAIALLDHEFKILPADLPHLSLPPARLAALKSKIENRAPSNRDEWRASSSDASRAASTPQQEKSKTRGSLPPGELSLVFLTDPALAKIHADFMADPTATDVITFEGDPLAELAGEICVSADTAAKYVGLPLVGRPTLQLAFATELTLYLVHGWLHLAGYDDLQPAKKRRMRAAESRAMKLLQAAGAIPPFRLT
jgi:probable rRNA maturation factor